MTIRPEDTVCRFVRTRDWSTELEKPKSRCFKGPKMSVWHEGRLIQKGHTLDVLRFGELGGSGQLTLTVEDYYEIAAEVAAILGCDFQVQVILRTEDQFVGELWRPWCYAHAQVESVTHPTENLPKKFRDLVILKAQLKGAIIPPDDTL